MFFINSYTSRFIFYKKHGFRPFASCQHYTVLPSAAISSALSPSLFKIILSEISGRGRLAHAARTSKAHENLPGPRSGWSCLGPGESRGVGFPRSLPVILCLPAGGRASKRFWRRTARRGAGAHSNRSKPFQTCAGLSEVCIFPSAVLGSKLHSAGRSPQGMRTCYVPQLLHRRLGSAGGTRWCDTFEATKLDPWFIFKAQRDG